MEERRSLHKKGLDAICIYRKAGLVQKDVYERAGVSWSTFDKYLYNPKILKEATRKKIEEVLQEIKQ
jgi:hypothetical protein